VLRCDTCCLWSHWARCLIAGVQSESQAPYHRFCVWQWLRVVLLVSQPMRPCPARANSPCCGRVWLGKWAGRRGAAGVHGSCVGPSFQNVMLTAHTGNYWKPVGPALSATSHDSGWSAVFFGVPSLPAGCGLVGIISSA
jgi:hypothetical protein